LWKLPILKGTKDENEERILK